MLATCSNNKTEIIAQILKLESRAPHCTWGVIQGDPGLHFTEAGFIKQTEMSMLEAVKRLG